MKEPDGWIDLTDFSKGIVHNKGSLAMAIGSQLEAAPTGVAPGPDGAASIDQTYRCIALPGGGLGPLPNRSFSYARPSVSVAVSFWRSVQMFVNGPIFSSSSFNRPNPRNFAGAPQVEFFLSFDGLDSSAPHERIFNWYRDRVWTATQVSGVWTVTAGNVDLLYHEVGGSAASSGLAFGSTTWMEPYYYASGLTGPAVVGSWQAPDASPAMNGLRHVFPDLTSSGTSVTATPLQLGANFTKGRILVHQGRIVMFPYTTYNDGPGTYTRETNDAYVFSTIQGTVTDALANPPNIVTQDSMTGIGCAASISASDMLLITHTKGAALVQGDIANPTVRRMPAAVGTAGTECIGVMTPVGYVYGVNHDGIYAWTGESSIKLSAQLPNDCWAAGGIADLTLGYMGRFALWNNWVVCPNNWIYDIGSNAWWRLDNTDTINDPTAFVAYEYMASPYDGILFANQSTTPFDGGTPLSGFIQGYAAGSAASNWSWKSQPLSRSRNRVVEIREVELVGEGSGSFTVTFTARDGTTQSQTLTLPTGPVSVTNTTHALRASYSVQGTDIQVQVKATTGNVVAPVLHSLRIGYNERMHIGAG